MVDFIRDKKQFIIICIVWLLTGQYAAPVAYAIIPITILLWYTRGSYDEILLGFVYILTLSDNRFNSFHFAGVIKNFYIVLLALFTFMQRSEAPKINLSRYFYLFYAVAFFCIIYSPEASLSFQKTLSYVLLFYAVPNYVSKIYSEYGNDFFKNLIWMILSLLLLGLVINVVNPFFTNLDARYRGILGNPNGLGIYCLLFLILFEFVREKDDTLFTGRERLFVYFVAGYSLLRCGARSSLMALVLFYFFRRFYRVSPVLGFVVFLLSIAAYEYVSLNLESIILSLGLENYLRLDTLENASGRLVAWQFGWYEVQKNFFIGRGFYYTEYLYISYAEYLNKLGHQGTAHNSYLTLWLDTGLVGLSFFAGGLLTLFYKIAKLSRSAMPLLFAVLFSNQFESWLTASLNPYTIIFLISISIVIISARDAEEAGEDHPEEGMEVPAHA